MEIKNILVYVGSRTVLSSLSPFILNLARSYNARLFALAIIPLSRNHLTSRAEENAWRKLYEIEEDAFEVDRKISLLLEEVKDLTQKTILNKITEIVRSYRIDLLVVPDHLKIPITKLTKELSLPIIIFPASKE
jgi:hypothetical protein